MATATQSVVLLAPEKVLVVTVAALAVIFAGLKVDSQLSEAQRFRQKNSKERRSAETGSDADCSSPAVSPTTRMSGNTAMPPLGDEQDCEDDYEKLFERKDLEDIYKNLRSKAAAEFGPGSSRTIWKNRDFRVDVGHYKDGVRHWEFQVNSNPVSQAAKRLLKASGKKGSHKKFFEGKFDTNNPAEYEEWKREFLSALGWL